MHKPGEEKVEKLRYGITYDEYRQFRGSVAHAM